MKSRDMHWALVAHREQRDINLSSLRMLVVADGSNPCENKLSKTLRHFVPWNRLNEFNDSLTRL